VLTIAAPNDSGNSQPPVIPRSANAVWHSATVYAPVAISAPCPSDSWPLSPVRTVSPAVAQR
jgi:hypothetical protein